MGKWVVSSWGEMYIPITQRRCMNFLTQLLLIAPPILLALTVHEYAHGLVADRLGDPTARYAGRLTLNPLAHLDPIGTLMLFVVHFGWARPVPVNPYNLRNPHRDMLWVSLAGPGANLALALLLGLPLRFFDLQRLGTGTFMDVAALMLVYGVFFNIILAIFNLIPIPPLDGSKILAGLLPAEQAWKFQQFERYGPMLLLGLIIMGSILHIPVLSMFLRPFVSFFSYLFTGHNLGAVL